MLLLCTGNICRSPMAEALLRARLGDAGVDARVHSAGMLSDGEPASAHGVAVLAERGLDLSAHRSRCITADLVRGADLVLGMARQHVHEAVVLVPEVFPRAYTLKELVRRGEETGPRHPEQPVAGWLDGLHRGRVTTDLVGRSSADDIADPIGGPAHLYARTAAEIDDLLVRFVDLVWGKEPR